MLHLHDGGVPLCWPEGYTQCTALVLGRLHLLTAANLVQPSSLRLLCSVQMAIKGSTWAGRHRSCIISSPCCSRTCSWCGCRTSLRSKAEQYSSCLGGTLVAKREPWSHEHGLLVHSKSKIKNHPIKLGWTLLRQLLPHSLCLKGPLVLHANSRLCGAATGLTLQLSSCPVLAIRGATLWSLSSTRCYQ
jgi:hypothetical protein